MNALLATALPAGGTIGIVSPASPYNTYSDVLRGIAWWEAHGYRVKLAEGALERRLFLNSISRSLPRIPNPLWDSRILQLYIRRCFASQAWRPSTARPLLPSEIQRCPISPLNGCYRC